MQLRVLIPNLAAGRGGAAAPRLRDSDWDVALLGHASPRLTRALARAAGAEYRHAGPAGRDGPAIVVRHDRIAAARVQRLRRWPQRDRALGVELGFGLWLVNAAVRTDEDERRALELTGRWSPGGPALCVVRLGRGSFRVSVSGPIEIVSTAEEELGVHLFTP